MLNKPEPGTRVILSEQARRETFPQTRYRVGTVLSSGPRQPPQCVGVKWDGMKLPREMIAFCFLDFAPDPPAAPAEATAQPGEK
jgi:hypothetical protein